MSSLEIETERVCACIREKERERESWQSIEERAKN